MCRSRKLLALCPVMPYQGQPKTTLLALPIIPGEWWSHWPGISKQGQPTQGTFLRHHIYLWPLRPDRRSMMIWSQVWTVRVIQSHQGPGQPSHRTQGSLWLPQDSGGLTHILLGWSSLTPLGLGEHQNHSQGTKWAWRSPCKCTVQKGSRPLSHTSECSQRLLWEYPLVK